MRSLEEMPEVWGSTGRSKEKLKFGAEKSDVPIEKSSENGLKTGKSGKNGDFGVKKVGWGSGEKTDLTADFAML